MLLTTTFWPNEKVNQQLTAVAVKNDWELVSLTDLGDLEENKAIGLFENYGVAEHPGDLGMKRISDRIFNVLQKLI